MKWYYTTAIVCTLLLAAQQLSAQQPAKTAPAAEPPAPAAAKLNPSFKTFKEQSSYAVGLDIARNLKAQGLDIDAAMVAKGFADAFGNGKPILSDKELQATMVQFQNEAAAKAQEMFAKVAEKNKKEGAAFLAENKKKEGVKTTASGLQYKILKQGTGAAPKPDDVVTTHYRGTFLDGTEFDSTYRTNQPATFPVSSVIKGWKEALQAMRVGDKWQLFVPSDLAYGPQGRDEIPPNATLVFEIELLDTRPAPAPAKTAPQGANTLPGPNE